jgi:RNA polymerase sigma-70 factor (ECF subfamily)
LPDPRDQWEKWVADHAPAALLYARHMTRSLADAEDALHEGFLRFWRNRGNARDPAALLFACVKSAILDSRRGTLRRTRREQQRPSPQPLFETAEDLARQELVEKGLAALPEEQREAVILKIWGGLTFAEIAHATHTPLHTIAARYRYALEKLAHTLTPEDCHD